MDDRRDRPWRWWNPWLSGCTLLVLLASCGTPATPGASSAPGGSGASNTSVASSGQAESTESEAPATSPTLQERRNADAPAPVPVPGTEAEEGDEIKAPAASLAALSEHALPVRTYGSEAPERCGLPTPTSASPPSSVQVFFGCTPESGPVVGAVPARVVAVPEGSRPERVALEALLAGPTAEERRTGYVSNFGEGSRRVGVEVEVRNDGMAVVNFDQAIREQGRAFVSNIDTRQVVATLGQFPSVERVLILVEGEPLCKALGEC